MEDDLRLVHIRLPRSLIRRVDHVGIEMDLRDRASTIERILREALPTMEQQAGIARVGPANV